MSDVHRAVEEYCKSILVEISKYNHMITTGQIPFATAADCIRIVDGPLAEQCPAHIDEVFVNSPRVRACAQYLNKLLQKGVLLRSETLDLAVRWKHVDIVRKLIASGCIPTRDTFEYAVSLESSIIALVLLDMMFIVSQRAFDIAVNNNHIELVSELIRRMPGEHRIVSGAIRSAIARDRVTMAELLLVHMPTMPTGDVLEAAVEWGKIALAERLITAGCTITPLALETAITHGYLDLVYKMLPKYARVVSNWALESALANNHAELALRLIIDGCHTSSEAMGSAIVRRNVKVVTALLDRECKMSRSVGKRVRDFRRENVFVDNIALAEHLCEN